MNAGKCPRCSNKNTTVMSYSTNGCGGSTAVKMDHERQEARFRAKSPLCKDRDCYMGKVCDVLKQWPHKATAYCWDCDLHFC